MIQCLLCKREDLGLNLQHPCKKPGKAAHACDSSIEGLRLEGLGSALAGQPSQKGQLQVQ